MQSLIPIFAPKNKRNMEQVIQLINEMSPYLLLGFLIAGIMHAFIPGSFYTRYLSRKTFRSVIYAALLGIPLPLCSCGVIPTAMSLRREGASKGAVVSFLIATPQTGIDSIFATYSIMGLPFALVRPIAALVTAVMGGALVNFGDRSSSADTQENASQPSPGSKTIAHRIKEALQYGFVEMMADIGKWLVLGLIIAGLITVFVPESMFAAFKDNTLMSMLLVLCISIPMYLCATGSIPIAVALMLKGLTPGAALVLLMAGPASNAASILVINKVLGRKTLCLYLISIICGAIAFGYGIDYLMPREWFAPSIIRTAEGCTHSSPFQWTCTILLTILLLNILRMKLMHGNTCSCEHHHDHCHTGHCHTDGTTTLSFTIKGMNCTHCRTNAEKALYSCTGVEHVNIDLQSGNAQVTGHDLDVQAMDEALKSIGFEMHGNTPPSSPAS